MYMNFPTDSLLLKASVNSRLLVSCLPKLRFTPRWTSHAASRLFQVIMGFGSLGLSFQSLPVNTMQGNLHILLLESSEHHQPGSIYPLLLMKKPKLREAYLFA